MKSYTDFLKESKFLRWQLIPDDELEQYWKDFRNQHPEIEIELQRAIIFLKKEGLNKSRLDETGRAFLFNRIQATIRKREKLKLLRHLGYSAAAIALLMIGITIFYPRHEVMVHTADQELIVGKLLNSEDIQLKTSEESVSFQHDIDLKISEKGTVRITQNNSDVHDINLEKDKPSTLIIPYGKRSTLTLADGSKVWLNSGSVLEFPSKFNEKKREITLSSGEMYIEVVPNKNKPFYVRSSSFNVRVHGTKFNMTNYSGYPQSVVLVEGSVSLHSEGKREIFITPSEKAIYSLNGTFETKKVDVNQHISWKDGYLSFYKTPMTEVLQKIGRYYNLSFNYDQDVNLQKRTCSGKIYLSENIDNVMSTICILSSTIFTRKDNQIFITHKPY